MAETAPPAIPSVPTPGTGSAAAILAPGTPAPPPPPAAPAAVPPPPPPTATAPLTPWKEGEVWTLGEGDKAVPWYETVPEEAVRETMKAKAYKTPAELAVAYSNLLKLQNGNDTVLAFPPENATPEQIAAFDKGLRAKLGVPETPDKYDLKLGDKPDAAFVEFGKKQLHAMGVPPAKAQAFVDAWNTFVGEQAATKLAADNTANDAAVTALETRWGAELDQNLAAGRVAMNALGLSPELLEKVESKIGTAEVVEFLALLGKKSGEADWLGGKGGQPPGDTPETMTKEAAQSKINALNADTEFSKKYMDKNHPEHAQSVEFMERLHKRIALPT